MNSFITSGLISRTGSVTLLFVLCWQFLVADRPTKHRRISQAELSYIAKFVSAKTKEEVMLFFFIQIYRRKFPISKQYFYMQLSKLK